MKKKLYKVTYICQDNGELECVYVLAKNMNQIENEYSNLDSIKLLPLIVLS